MFILLTEHKPSRNLEKGVVLMYSFFIIILLLLDRFYILNNDIYLSHFELKLFVLNIKIHNKEKGSECARNTSEPNID